MPGSVLCAGDREMKKVPSLHAEGTSSTSLFSVKSFYLYVLHNHTALLKFKYPGGKSTLTLKSMEM